MTFEFDAEKVCAKCDGDGRLEAASGRYDDVTGALITREYDCPACDGKGTTTVHVRPIDMEDLAQIHGDDDPYGAFAYRGGNP
jgi:DnaJ-class molecular chaperone